MDQSGIEPEYLYAPHVALVQGVTCLALGAVSHHAQGVPHHKETQLEATPIASHIYNYTSRFITS